MASELTQRDKSPANRVKPEGMLYHYTTQHGLLGILKQKSIWATHIRYLNDTSEGNIVSQVIFEEFSGRFNTAPLFQTLGIATDKAEGVVESVDEDTLGQGSAMASYVTSQNVFVSSFSEHGDSLSQWRAYSERSGGYSVGFRPEYLRAVGERFLGSRPDRFFQASDPLSAAFITTGKREKTLRDEIKTLVGAYIAEAATAAKLPSRRGTSRIQDASGACH